MGTKEILKVFASEMVKFFIVVFCVVGLVVGTMKIIELVSKLVYKV